MKIWHLDCDVDNYESFTWKGDINIDDIQSFDGRSKKDNWIPIAVEKIGSKVLSNTPGLSSHIPIFDELAILTLKDLLNDSTEILPIKYSEGNYFIINIIDVINCIDYKKSEYKTFRDGKRIMRFIKYEFIENIVKDKHIFKIIDEPTRRPFVSDEFKRRVEESGLTGFKFELVWDSEA